MKQVDGKSVTFYQVAVNLGRRKWTMEKRYNEFAELDKVIRSNHPNLPNMPSKTFFAMREMANLENRRVQLHAYLEVSTP